MSIYDVTYSKLGQQVLPPDKRNSKMVAFVTCLLAPMQWLRDLWLGSYRTGASAQLWATGITYLSYNEVIYNNKSYQSIQDANLNNQPDVSPLFWTPIQQNIIGVSERLLYNGQCIVLTWALNKWFSTSFSQPTPQAATVVQQIGGVATIACTAHGFTTGQHVNISGFGLYPWFKGFFTITVIDANTFTYPLAGADFVPITTDNGFAFALSGIYIQNNFVANTSPFRSGAAETQSSVVYTGKSSDVVINAYSFTGQVNFTIYIPTATYTAIAATNAARDATVRAFVNQYLPAGLLYSIQPY